MIKWLLGGRGDPREQPVALLPDHELLVTPNGQVEGRELYRIIAETRAGASARAAREGYFTLGENIGDLGGLTIALKA